MNLLSLDQAALLILHAMRALADPYAPDALKKAVEDKELALPFTHKNDWT